MSPLEDGQRIISDGALVAITLMIAESDPKEKDVMVALVMNLLRMRGGSLLKNCVV